MKKFEYILGIAAIALSLAACTKTGQNYEPNPPYPGDNVFFPQDLNTKIELEKGATFFQVPLLRSANIDKATAITIEATGPAIDEGYVLAPTGALFEENKDTSLVYFLVDAEKLGLNNEVSFTVTITDPAAVTPYGDCSATFKVSIPLPWLKFGAGGTFYEAPDFWNEEEQKQIEYQEISDKIWFCKIPQCFGKNTIAGGGEYDCQDYTFYWNKETDILYPVSAYMGYTKDSNPYVFGTEAEWILFSNEIDPGEPGSEGWFNWIDKARSVAAASGYSYVPYYDGNGIFYLCDCYFVDLKVNPNGSGYWDMTPDMFVDDAFVHADYSCDVEYSGMFVSLDQTAYALVDFTGGADVTGVKYVVSDQTVDPFVSLMGIISGADNVQDITLEGGAAQARLLLETGLYRVVAVPYNSASELQTDGALYIDFYFPGLNAPAPKEVEAKVVVGSTSMFYSQEVRDANGMTDYNSVGFGIIGTEIKSCTLFFTSAQQLAVYRKTYTDDVILANGDALPATYVDKINSASGFVNVFLGLSPATEYEMLVGLENVYGSTKVFDVKYTTAAAPAPTSAKTDNGKVDFKNTKVLTDGAFKLDIKNGWGTKSAKLSSLKGNIELKEHVK